jgi:hypothetical protein
MFLSKAPTQYQWMRLAFWPLFLLLLVLSPFKQILPHWAIPAFWITIPFAIQAPIRSRFLYKLNLSFIVILLTVPTSILSVPEARERLLLFVKERPGGLAELTLWKYVAENPTVQAYLDHDSSVDAPSHCPERLVGSMRWFWVSHLTFELPKDFKIISLDFNHPSYYHQKDRVIDFAECPITIIASQKHIDENNISKIILIEKRENILIWGHKDIDVVLLKGNLTDAQALGQVKLFHGI